MNWIKCKDELPPILEDVFLCARASDITTLLGSFDKGEIYGSVDRLNQCMGDDRPMFCAERFYDSKPIAWMKIPEFPDELD